MRPPTTDDAPAIASLESRGGEATTAEVVLRDWERDGFDLAADAVVIGSGSSVDGFAAVYPGGWLVIAARDATQLPQLVEWAMNRATELGESTRRALIPISEGRLVDLLRSIGFIESSRLRTYSLVTEEATARAPSQPNVAIRSVADRADEQAIYALAARTYGDGPTFESWRRWIANWAFDPRLWLVATRLSNEVVGGAVGISFPNEGWVKRIAVAAGADSPEVARELLAELLRRFRELGHMSVGMPIGSNEPAYLHELARQLKMSVRSDQLLLEVTEA